jgi:nitronate monooxygenase
MMTLVFHISKVTRWGAMSMWRDRRLCDLFGIDHPIFQAPMTGTCTPALAGAVSNAGGLGSLGCAQKSVDLIRQQVKEIRGFTNRAFNLNFFANDAAETDRAVLDRTRERLRPWYDRLGLGNPPTELPACGPGFDDALLELLLDLGPKVASFYFGCPEQRYVDELKAAGIVVISTATSVAEARSLEVAGVDAIIAQGWEAGGHRGSFKPTAPWEGVGTMALIPQVVDAVSVPVIAAGGIGDGRGIAAALALGAAGVQMGTAFLGCPETATGSARRARLRSATDLDTIVTDAFSGRCARAVRSRFAEEMDRDRQPLPAFIQMYTLSGPIVAAAAEVDASFILYGQTAALTKDISAAEMMALLVSQTRSVMTGLGSN